MNLDNLEHQIGGHLLQQLKCCICMEIYNDPTALPCGHTFCYNCLLDLAKHKKRQVKNPFMLMEMTVPCPNCRCGVAFTNIMTKTNGVVPNFVLMSIIESYQQMGQPRSQVDASTNTETFAMTGQRINEISSELDSLMISTKAKTSILQGCKDEIDCIRLENQNYIENQLSLKYQNNAGKTNEIYNELKSVTGSSNELEATPPGFVTPPFYHNDPGVMDPAILSIGGNLNFYPPPFQMIPYQTGSWQTNTGPWQTNAEC
ncbi:E3 ubiquitin-protein ligase RNF135-like [Ylistrum balloti]|uniref:E3 ubiquitin-protein ligase RNF135-like n=1 Tax=Ylistrum balloti TaxID=509963 RepID=UPI002905D324|nr:E3 ubiquitin-protein ligase RNF135-like [Ylistrum balloti]